MEYVALVIILCLICGALAFILGMVEDVWHGIIWRHTIDSVIVYLLVCLITGPYALLYVLGLILDKDEEK